MNLDQAIEKVADYESKLSDALSRLDGIMKSGDPTMRQAQVREEAEALVSMCREALLTTINPAIECLSVDSGYPKQLAVLAKAKTSIEGTIKTVEAMLPCR